MTERECPHCTTPVEEGAGTCPFCGEDVAAPPRAVAGVIKVSWGFADLRAVPSATGELIDRLRRDTPVEIIGQRDGYAQVRLPGRDMEGWVPEGFVVPKFDEDSGGTGRCRGRVR